MYELSKKNIESIIFVDIISLIIVAFNLKWMETHDYTIFNTLIRIISIACFVFLAKIVDNLKDATALVMYVCFLAICFMCIDDLFRIADLICYFIEFVADVLFFWI